MRRVRIVPWLLAIAGVTVPYILYPPTWPLALIWWLVLGAVWLVGGTFLTTRTQRLAAGLILLPVLFMLAFEGGWWLIPADLAWLAIEALDRDVDQRAIGPIAR